MAATDSASGVTFAAPFPRWPARGPFLLEALRRFHWRLVFVLVLCAALATEVLAQPSVFEFWSLDAVVATRFNVDADQRYDGTIDGEFVWGKGKARAVADWVTPS